MPGNAISSAFAANPDRSVTASAPHPRISTHDDICDADVIPFTVDEGRALKTHLPLFPIFHPTLPGGGLPGPGHLGFHDLLVLLACIYFAAVAVAVVLADIREWRETLRQCGFVYGTQHAPGVEDRTPAAARENTRA